MRIHNGYQMSYFRFLVYCVINIFRYKALKGKNNEILYYKSYGKDFFLIVLFFRIFSLLLLLIYFLLPEIFFNIKFEYQYIYAIIIYILAIILFGFITIAIYSTKYKNINFYPIDSNNNTPPDKYILLNHIFHYYDPFLVFFNKKQPIVISNTSNLKFTYRSSSVLDRLIKALIILLYCVIGYYYSTIKMVKDIYGGQEYYDATKSTILISAILCITILILTLFISKFKKSIITELNNT